MRVLMIATVALLAGACSQGPSIRTLPHTTNPVGADITMDVYRTRYKGELIAVEDSGYVLRNSTNRLVFVPFGLNPRVLTAGFGRAISGRPLDEELRVLRLSSRYPYGLSPEVRRALLAQRSQTEMERAQ